MSTVVLVAGAWHGAWCWQRVLPALWRAGHVAVPVPLTGVGERAHQLSAEVGLGTHVEDVVATVRAQECRDAVLVGHSYGGLVVTGAADRLGSEVGRLVYLDAVVPLPGRSWADSVPEATRAQREALITAHGHIPPAPAAAYGLTGDDAAWVERRQTPHPAGAFAEPLHFDAGRWAARPRTYVDCTAPALPTIEPSRRLVRSQPGWEVVGLATGHDPMVSAPEELAAVLLAAADRR
ncbi:Alpha/beta hydrolase family protein [Geodermatophilus pulveris]|uniref:Alpha/beta hydrolase family protein n=1 Tax=Geodermatophilus pulveris TaxID=1564159 RepID=A0A239EHI6_9ACTN|nr:alpha/beta hydrolase [Geodermatophilus pulveris]SNS43354.1 Alpha/beta hydrolase family protein [Geodermatophilus pulveris]